MNNVDTSNGLIQLLNDLDEEVSGTEYKKRRQIVQLQLDPIFAYPNEV